MIRWFLLATMMGSTSFANEITIRKPVSSIEELIESMNRAKVERSNSAQRVESGTNIGGGFASSDDLSAWCSTSMMILDTYYSEAELMGTNFFEANKLLSKGLFWAHGKVSNETNSTFTLKALERGIELVNILGAVDPMASSETLESANNVLRYYYQFVLNNVSKSLDLNGFIPLISTVQECADCTLDFESFEYRFVEYAKAQLELIALSTLGKVDNVYYPVGDKSHFLKALELFSEKTKEDLEGSLWRERFSCVIVSLDALYMQLTLFNQGSRSIYRGNASYAVQGFAIKLEKIISNLENKTGCL